MDKIIKFLLKLYMRIELANHKCNKWIMLTLSKQLAKQLSNNLFIRESIHINHSNFTILINWLGKWKYRNRYFNGFINFIKPFTSNLMDLDLKCLNSKIFKILLGQTTIKLNLSNCCFKFFSFFVYVKQSPPSFHTS